MCDSYLWFFVVYCWEGGDCIFQICQLVWKWIMRIFDMLLKWDNN